VSKREILDAVNGLCESPHDHPPKWAAMLTAYFDESFQAGDGYVVVAGFLGSRDHWTQCAGEWRKALGAKRSLHMKNLRWSKPSRHKELLERLGAVPHACGLQPLFAAVRLSDYEIAEDVPKPFRNGYYVAMAAIVMGLLGTLPKGERVELIFEQQRQHAAVREAALELISEQPWYRVKRRKLLAKWGSAPKSTLLEPSDYLAYAIMQTLVDKYSVKAQLCSPILKEGRKRIGGKLGPEQVAKIITLKRKGALIL